MHYSTSVAIVLCLAAATAAILAHAEALFEFEAISPSLTASTPEPLQQKTDQTSLEFWGFDVKSKTSTSSPVVASTTTTSAVNDDDDDDGDTDDGGGISSAAEMPEVDYSTQPAPPPAYMVNLYNSITDPNGVMKVPNPYGAKMIIALQDQNTASEFSLDFDVSDVAQPTAARILAAELHLFVERSVNTAAAVSPPVLQQQPYVDNTFAYWDPNYGVVMEYEAQQRQQQQIQQQQTQPATNSSLLQNNNTNPNQNNKFWWNMSGRQWQQPRMAAKLMLYEESSARESPTTTTFKRLVGSRRLPPMTNPRWVVFNVESTMQRWQMDRRREQTEQPLPTTADKNIVRFEVLLTSGINAANKLRADSFGLTFKSSRRANSYRPALILYLDDGSTAASYATTNSDAGGGDSRQQLLSSTMRPRVVGDNDDDENARTPTTVDRSANYKISDSALQNAYAQRKLRESGHADVAERYGVAYSPAAAAAGDVGDDDNNDDEDDNDDSEVLLESYEAGAATSRRFRRSALIDNNGGGEQPQYYGGDSNVKSFENVFADDAEIAPRKQQQKKHRQQRLRMYSRAEIGNAVVGYTDEDRMYAEAAAPVVMRHTPRRTRRHRYKVRQMRSCRKQSFKVSFAAIGWSSWIISPQGYDAYDCRGSCKFPIAMESKPTNHATVQSIVATLQLGRSKGPCCVPDTLLPISLLYYNDKGNVVLRQHDDMVVGSCACR